MKALLFILLVLSSQPFIINGQSEYGSSVGNYLTSSNSRLNPASAALMKTEWVVSPFAANINVLNNYVALNMPYSPYRIINNSVPSQYKSNNQITFNWNWLKVNSKEAYFNINSSVVAQGPAVFVKQKSFVFGVYYDFNVYTRLSGLPSHIVKGQIDFLQSNQNGSLDTLSYDGFSLQDHHNINLLHHRYQTINFTVGKSFKLKNQQTLAFGINYKLINSFSGLQFTFKSGQYVNSNSSSSPFPNINTMMNLTEMKGMNNKFSIRSLGAIDLGFEWIYKNKTTQRKPNYSKYFPDYKFRFGMSLLDIGNLIYNRTIINDVRLNQGYDRLDINFNSSTSNKDLVSQMEDKIRSSIQVETNYGKRISVGLPTRLNLYNDFQLRKNIFVNALIVKNLRNRNKNKNMFRDDWIQVAPRIEFKYFELGLPISYNSFDKTIKQGLNLRFMNFFIGTPNLISLINIQNTSEVSIFLGFQISNFKGQFIKKKTPYMKTKRRTCSEF